MSRLLPWPHLFAVALVALVAGGCDSAEESNKRPNIAIADPSLDGGASAPKCTDVGKAYVGFAGTKLEEGRASTALGSDRARIKPYSALRGEYERTIGVVPPGLEQASASFGAPPARFSSEPRANAIQVYSAFRVAFDGCLSFTESPPEFATAPTKETAQAQCATLARRFWSRAPTPAEIDQCTQVAVTDSASEGDPRRRWAYTCATLLSSTGFLTY